MAKVKPITPAEVVKKKQETLPDGVIEAFNEAIAENWDGRSSTVLQKHVVTKIAKKLKVGPAKIFDKGYLDVESIFRKAGWDVEYDKPAYNEDYEASFKFRKKRKSNG